MVCHVPFVICRDAPLRLWHVLCVVCRHVTLRVLPCAVACTDVALRLCHVQLHAGIWHSGCAMCCVLYAGMPSWHAEGQPASLEWQRQMSLMATGSYKSKNLVNSDRTIFIWRYLITHRDVHFKVPLASMTVLWAVYLVELAAQLL